MIKDRETGKEVMCEEGGRHNNVSASQNTGKTASIPQKLEEIRKFSSLVPSWRMQP